MTVYILKFSKIGKTFRKWQISVTLGQLFSLPLKIVKTDKIQGSQISNLVGEQEAYSETL